MKNHWLWMLLACVAPILLIFLLPFFGITSDLTFALFLVVFFVAHLFMMRGHSHGHGGADHHHHRYPHADHPLGPRSMRKG